MSANDQLEREVEAALARLATDAVPDARHAPVPPWREQDRRSRAADVRRFGRATPWLIAAVLLVIAGLGVGAGVAFDSSAPDRAPVGTQPPGPSATITAPDGTLGTPTTSPSSHPTFSRTSNGTAPDDGVATGPLVVGVGQYGPALAGMTQAAALTALGLGEQDVTAADAQCFRFIPLPGQAVFGAVGVYIDANTGKVVRINPATDAVDLAGNGIGSTLADVRAAFPGGRLTYSYSGWVFSVLADGGDRGTAYVLSTDNVQTATPADTDTVTELIVGDSVAAGGGELYAEC